MSFGPQGPRDMHSDTKTECHSTLVSELTVENPRPNVNKDAMEVDI